VGLQRTTPAHWKRYNSKEVYLNENFRWSIGDGTVLGFACPPGAMPKRTSSNRQSLNGHGWENRIAGRDSPGQSDFF
jgi:hypothetical protein